jgi:hypothetical protein
VPLQKTAFEIVKTSNNKKIDIEDICNFPRFGRQQWILIICDTKKFSPPLLLPATTDLSYERAYKVTRNL